MTLVGNLRRAEIKRNGWLLTIWACSLTLPVLADQFVVESEEGGQNTSWATKGGSWFTSSGKITGAEGATPTAGTAFMLGADATMTLTPTCGTAGVEYLLEFAMPFTDLTPCALTLDVTLTGATGLTNALGENKTEAFGQMSTNNGAWIEPGCDTNSSASPCCIKTNQNIWAIVGTFTLDAGVTQPTIVFSNPSLSGFGARPYLSAFRFTRVGDPCLTVPRPGLVNGPLAVGQTFVDVPGIINGAASVTVYANGVQIGQNTTAEEGLTRVITSALVKDQQITASQTVGGQESCVLGTGPRVGGGTNPRIRVNFILRHNDALTGPVGTNGGTTPAGLYVLGSSGPKAGFQSAPNAGTVLSPGTCWQTVSFTHGTDPEYNLNAIASTPGAFAVLAGIAFCIDDTDTGPYNIFIDNILNGTNVIESFESATTGASRRLFSLPRFSALTSAALLTTPDITAVSAANADTGTKSVRINWQFKDTLPSQWLYLATQGTNGTPNPMVDLSQPISARLLVLPVGSATGALKIAQPVNRTNSIGTNSVFTANASGSGPFRYQWSKDGVPLTNGGNITGATNATLTVSNVQQSDAGAYSAAVNGPVCSAISNPALLILPSVQPSNIVISQNGATVTLTWTLGVLQSSEDVAGPYTDVLGAASPHDVDTTLATQKYYRLRSN